MIKYLWLEAEAQAVFGVVPSGKNGNRLTVSYLVIHMQTMEQFQSKEEFWEDTKTYSWLEAEAQAACGAVL
jgi:hypothetical protein